LCGGGFRVVNGYLYIGECACDGHAANFDRMQTDLDSLKPRERLEMIIALSRFVVPTIRSIELKTDEARPFPAFAIRIDGQIEQMEEEYQSIDHALSDDDE